MNDPYTQAVARTNSLFITAASIHLCNALMYSAVWPWSGALNPASGKPWTFLSWVQYPELFNVIEASLLLYSVSMYSKEKVTGLGRYLDATTLTNHKVQLAAALAQLAAALGWWHVFLHTHEHAPGRGLTLDDPEFLALIFVLVPSILYVVYYASVVVDPMNFRNFRINQAINAVFESGDVLYFLGAFMYAVTSFRDSGFFTSLGLCEVGQNIWLRMCWGSKAPPAPLRAQPSLAALEVRAAAPALTPGTGAE